MMTNLAHKAFYYVFTKVNYCATNFQSSAEEESIDKVVWWGEEEGAELWTIEDISQS